ncbi:hypothetical protein F3Y22_tig00000656pilonHSYRG00016 [Hibiscus syriacus]|uniref:Uncharacterized protein n=1 Tax=Hibiscus syriacus TaxID=106335 RepID=A0A6A3D4U1_HIBSY|nr:hypothetical protein F3Y22_tig00000656pilonHSYRG00016 [Hibiscus syriacus]
MKTPFHPRDVLPLLPRQVSWPILNSLNSAVNLLPTFVGFVSSQNHIVSWKGECFYENTAWMEFHNKSGNHFGGGTPYQGEKEGNFYFHDARRDAWNTSSSMGMSLCLLIHNGVRMPIFGFSRNTWGIHSNHDLCLRTQTLLSTIYTREISWYYKKFVGHGVVSRLLRSGSGSYAGHSAIFLKDSKGKLCVGESGHENDKGKDIIAIIPWEEWWNFELNKDEADPHIALLPLRPDVRAKFNETSAWEYALSMEGRP